MTKKLVCFLCPTLYNRTTCSLLGIAGVGKLGRSKVGLGKLGLGKLGFGKLCQGTTSKSA